MGEVGGHALRVAVAGVRALAGGAVCVDQALHGGQFALAAQPAGGVAQRGEQSLELCGGRRAAPAARIDQQGAGGVAGGPEAVVEQ